MTALFNGRTSKNQSNWSFVSDLSPDPSLTAQWGNNWLVMFTTSSKKWVSFYPSLCTIPLSIRLHALSAYWVSDSLQSSNGSHRWNTLLKMLEKWSAHSITSESIWSGVIFTRFKLERKMLLLLPHLDWNCSVLDSQIWLTSKSFWWLCEGWKIFSSLQLLY